MKALTVLSGGQDSTTCLYWALANFDEHVAITFDYGQKHRREIACAKKIAQMAGVEHEVIEVGKWFKSKRLKITINNTDSDNVKSSFAKLLLLWA